MTPIRIAYAKVAPGAVQGMYAASAYFDRCGFSQLLRRQVELRVSQINGCSYCIWLHSRQIKELGDTEERLAAVEHWRTALCFSDAEKAALAWAECVTRIGDGVPPDAVFEPLRHHFDDRRIVDLTAIIANMNSLNRMAISFRLEAPPSVGVQAVR
jgi:AhpD family alkylhydroperoxidase